MKTYAGVFASALLAELGDKRQLATLTLAATPGTSPLGVFVAAAAASSRCWSVSASARGSTRAT